MKSILLIIVTGIVVLNGKPATAEQNDDSRKNAEYWVYKISENNRGQKSETIVAHLLLTTQKNTKMILQMPISNDELSHFLDDRKIPNSANRIWTTITTSPSASSCVIDIVRGMTIATENECKKLAVGDRWETKMKHNHYDIDVSASVTSEEDIYVASKKLSALKIYTKSVYFKQSTTNQKNSNINRQNEESVATVYNEYWYVPEIRGIAKTLRRVVVNNFEISQILEDLVSIP